MKRMRPLATACALVPLIACASAQVARREGFIPVEGGRVWYQVVGGGSSTPLLVVHGGAGLNHFYLKPMARLAVDRAVIFYDQLGGGNSDRPADTTLWRMDRFVDEIARVRKALGLANLHLYGHSAGATLVAAYMETKPIGVRSVVFAGPALDPARFRIGRDSLIRSLPDSVSSVIIRHQRDQTLDAPEYLRANRVFLEHYHARRLPWSADLDSTIALNNPSVATFIRRGRPLPRYTDHLNEITVPTLFTVGRYDPSLSAARYYQSLVPGSELVILEQSAHLTMHDEPEHYNAVLRDFLQRADATARKNHK